MVFQEYIRYLKTFANYKESKRVKKKQILFYCFISIVVLLEPFYWLLSPIVSVGVN